MPEPVWIFFSYAHEDADLVEAVRRQLVLFDRQNIIRKWTDRAIPPGTDWHGVIDNRIKQAQIILLFASPDFFASDYCYDAEMDEALRRHDAGEARVIPVIARPCPWKASPFSSLQAVPSDGKPLTRWPDFDDACLDVAMGIMSVVAELNARPRASRKRRRVSEPKGTRTKTRKRR
jgi:hypothetical protein